MGSAPGDNIKMRGAQQVESANDPAKSNVGGSMYDWPMLSIMNSWTEGTILSGRSVRSTTMRSRPLRASNGDGYLNSLGVAESYIAFHSETFFATSVKVIGNVKVRLDLETFKKVDHMQRFCLCFTFKFTDALLVV